MSKNFNPNRPNFRNSHSLPKRRTYLSGNFNRDMVELKIKGKFKNPQTRKEEVCDETSIFITYLALALQNISDIIGTDLSIKREEKDVLSTLDKSGKLWECASFLWMYKVDNPKGKYDIVTRHAMGCEGEPDYKRFAKAIILKLWELRNMFVHSEASKVLILDKDFCTFIESELYNEAVRESLGIGRSTEKIFKLRLFNPNNDEKTRYEFSRNGIIFLICLALYKHDASEFIQQFKDKSLAPKEWELKKGFVRMSESDLENLRRKGGSTRAIIDAFTFYSMRSSRTDIDVMNTHYLNFANILNYLNKVPLASYNYLELKEEAERLINDAAKSNESNDNKEFKYLLHPRQKDRFLTLALAYIEDAQKLECIKFKRLDITVRPERSRYMFGKIPEGMKNEFGDELFDANGLNRHYAITNGMAEFEYRPESHYGDIHIASLRGSISEDEILRLLLAMFTYNKNDKALEPNKVLKKYLIAYHRILERMLNSRVDELSLEDAGFRRDFMTVSGKGEAALEADVFVEEMEKFFPKSLTRYFVKGKNEVDTFQLQDMLSKRLQTMQSHAEDFIKRMDRLSQWKELDRENRIKVGAPICPIGELKFPPRTCKVSDGELIKWVLKYLNINLLNAKDKYRQLPRGQRHRGAKDVEFQMLHRDIGRFGVDPSNLWRTLEKRAALNYSEGPLERLKDYEAELFKEEQRRCKGKLDRNGKLLRVGHTLTMLAYAAATLYAEACEDLEGYWCRSQDPEIKNALPHICRFYGVKTQLELDHKSLVKIILGIDLKTWERAFDYEKRLPREVPRRLEDAENLVATQIPVPNLLAVRSFKGSDFRFNRAFEEFKPYEDGKMALRDFYDVKPLIDYVQKLHLENKANAERNRRALENGTAITKYPNARYNDKLDSNKLVEGIETRHGDEFEEGVYGKRPPRDRVRFSASDLNRAIQDILTSKRQDKILLACAKYYWDEYMMEVVKTPLKEKIKGFGLADATDIRYFFTKSIEDTIEGVKIRMMPNDFAKPIYSVIINHIKELIPSVNPIPDTDTYSFYDLERALKDLQYREKSLRVKYIPAILKFEELGNEPVEELEQDALYEHYKKELLRISNEPLTSEEFFNVIKLRNRLVHPTRRKKDELLSLLNTNIDIAEATLQRFGCIKKQGM